MASTVSPGATVIAVPPSQLQLPFAPGLRTTERVASGAAALARAWVGPCNTALLPPAGAPGAGCGASGRLSTRLTGAPCCAIEPVASGTLTDTNGLSLNRDASPLQAATPMVVSASAATRGQHRARNISRTQDIATYPHAPQALS